MYILTTSYLHSFCVTLRRIGQLKRINVEHAKSSMLENKKNAKMYNSLEFASNSIKIEE